MANEQNLVPFTADQNREEAVKNGKKGGKASGKARRRKRAMKDIVLSFGKQEASPEVLAKLIEIGMVEAGETITLDEALVLAQYVKALHGNTQAAEFVRNTGGQKPIESVEVTAKRSKHLDDILSQLGGKGLEDGDTDEGGE